MRFDFAIFQPLSQLDSEIPIVACDGIPSGLGEVNRIIYPLATPMVSDHCLEWATPRTLQPGTFLAISS